MRSTRSVHSLRWSASWLVLLCGCAAGRAVVPEQEPPAGRGVQLSAAEARQGIRNLSFGVVSASQKVRPQDLPTGLPRRAVLRAGRNEFEAFQIVLTSGGAKVPAVSARLAQPLSGPTVLAAGNVTLYRVGYYEVRVPSNAEGAPGLWPDPLIPDIDTYVGERRNAFPMDVAAGESRLVWVDVLVPPDAPPGMYRGAVELLVGGRRAGTIPVELQVGRFTVPSTASLRSAFGMDYAEPCRAHTGTDTCDTEWNERAAYTLRERYVRAGLDHRFTISDVFFQPPTGAQRAYEELMAPLVRGTGRTRLRGARVTAVTIDGTGRKALALWANFARKHGFLDRLLYYPVDEPGDDATEWAKFGREAQSARAVDPAVKTIITAPLSAATHHGVDASVDIFVPVIQHLVTPSSQGADTDSSRRYRAWLRSSGGRRELWSYQSCMSHGCGRCGEPSPEEEYTGWPSRVIDVSAVQNRAFPWLAFLYGVTGELYFAVGEQLDTAWQPNGLCKFSGSGDGTLFYPGKPSVIGGQSDIPVESIRIKMIREGMEDYEYLLMAAARDRARTMGIAKQLFPNAHSCTQPVARLEWARAQLFALLAD